MAKPLRKYNYISIFIIFFIFNINCYASNFIIEEEDFEFASLAEYGYLLDDPTDEFTIEKILAQFDQLVFIKNKYTVLSTNRNKNQFWVKLNIENKSSSLQKLLLECDINLAKYISCYIIKNGKIIQHFEGGLSENFNTRVVKHPQPVFPIEIKQGEKSEIILRVDGKLDNITFPLNLYSPKAFQAYVQKDFIIKGIVIGILFLYLILFLVFTFVRPTPLFISYTIYVFFVLLNIIAHSNIGFQYFYPQFTELAHVDKMVMSILGAFALLIVVINYFKENYYSLKIRKRLWPLRIFLFTFIVLYVFREQILLTDSLYFIKPILFPPGWIFLLLVGLAVSIIIHVNYTKPTLDTKLFLLIYSVMLLSISSMVLYNYGLLSNTILSFNIMYFAFLFEVACLSIIFYRKIINFYDEKISLSLEIKDARREKIQAEAIKKMEQAKTRLYTNISHEFRTPLTIINGSLDRINGYEQEKKLIQKNNQMMLHLVNQLLDFEKIDAQKLRIKFQQSDIISFIRYLIESFHSFAQQKEIELKFISSIEHLMMDFDEEIIQKIISNLLSNAIKFTPINGEISLSITRSKDILNITVTDTGLGIPKEEQNKIFDRFYQVENEKTSIGLGTGIGLALCKELVTKLNGSIKIKSDVGHGSQFNINIPISNHAPIKSQTITNFVKPKEYLPASNGKKILSSTVPNKIVDLPLVLIVEDNKDVQDYIVQCLNKNHQIILANDGVQGLKKAIEFIPDIIISDLMMPNMDGYIFCEKLKKDNLTSHIPILLLTAKADQESKMKGLRQGADAYLIKPFNKEELSLRIENLYQGRKKIQAYFSNTLKKEKHLQKEITKENIFLNQIQQHVLEHLLDVQFGVEPLAKLMGISRPQLYRKIKALTNHSIAAYIRLVRLKEGKKLLQEGNSNVSQVAYQVGFKDPAYFSRCFNETFGKNPTIFLNN